MGESCADAPAQTIAECQFELVVPDREAAAPQGLRQWTYDRVLVLGCMAYENIIFHFFSPRPFVVCWFDTPGRPEPLDRLIPERFRIFPRSVATCNALHEGDPTEVDCPIATAARPWQFLRGRKGVRGTERGQEPG